MKILKIATDCSGIEAPIMALDELNIKYNHIFSSDINKHSEHFIKTNFPPYKFYDDMRNRDNSVYPVNYIDFYVSGIPCQSHSLAGNRAGLSDTRGKLYFTWFNFIKQCKPKIFVLENVANMVKINKGADWKLIWDDITSLNEYSVSYKILNTADYGIPHRRNRVYIVGILKSILIKPFTYPINIPCRPLSEFIDMNNKIPDILTNHQYELVEEYYKIYNSDPKTKLILIDINCSKKWIRKQSEICPTLMTANKFYSPLLQRRITTSEALKLQGIDDTKYIWNCSDGQKFKFAGNTMSLNVLKLLFTEIFNCVELATTKIHIKKRVHPPT